MIREEEQDDLMNENEKKLGFVLLTVRNIREFFFFFFFLSRIASDVMAYPLSFMVFRDIGAK